MKTLLSILTACVVACSAEGFEPVTVHDARIIGRVVLDGDRPAGDFPVYLVIDDRSQRTVITGADGTFVFEDAPVGPIVLVAHDGAGNGARRALTIYAGGDNDAGTMVVGLLRLEPGVLDIRGIGFEERILSVAPYADLIAIAPDGAPIVLSYEGEPGISSRGRLLRVDVENGTAEELIPGLWLMGALSLTERIIVADRAEREGPVAIDLSSRTIFYSSSSADLLVSSGDSGIYAIDDGIFAIEQRRDGDEVSVLARFDGSREDGPTFARWPTLVSSTADQLYVVEFENFTTILKAIDRRSWQAREVAVLDIFDPHPVTLENTLYLVGHEDEEMRVVSVELATGARATLHSESCGEGAECLGSVDVDRARREVVLLGGPDRGVLRVDSAGQVKSKAIAFDPASAAARCFEPGKLGACRMTVLGPDHLRLSSYYLEEPNTTRTLAADVIGDRVVRVIDEPVDRFAATFALTSVSAEEELVLMLDATGHRQLLLGPKGRELSMFRTVTFLNGARRAPLISLDRAYAYYLLEDPVHTTFSLFRVELPGSR